MKTKLILIKPAKRNWLRALYIITKRKLRKLTDEKLIVLLSAMVFLLQLFIILTAVAAPMHASAQGSVKQVPKPIGLQIGDRVPDVTITNIINYKTPTAKISDFKGKLLILDFWASWCSPCISMVPRMDSLHRKFKGKVQFLPITYQKPEEVLAFRKRLQRMYPSIPLNIPEVVQSTQLRSLFPHNSLPHYVWIGGDGIVKAITSFKEVNEEEINKILKGDSPALVVKNDPERVPYVLDKPMFIRGNGGDGEKLSYYRLLSGYVPGLAGGFRMQTDSSGTVITGRNNSIMALYQLALSDGTGRIPRNKVRLEVTQPEDLHSAARGDEYLKWMAGGKVFCYELRVPAKLKRDPFQLMREDLELFFPAYRANLEKRAIPALVLQRTSKSDKLKTKGGTPAMNFDAFGCKLTNTYLGHLLLRLDFYMQSDPRPVINETGITGRIDMELKCSLSNVEAMNKELAKYDLVLKEELRPVELLVIRDRKGGVE